VDWFSGGAADVVGEGEGGGEGSPAKKAVGGGRGECVYCVGGFGEG